MYKSIVRSQMTTAGGGAEQLEEQMVSKNRIENSASPEVPHHDDMSEVPHDMSASAIWGSLPVGGTQFCLFSLYRLTRLEFKP